VAVGKVVITSVIALGGYMGVIVFAGVTCIDSGVLTPIDPWLISVMGVMLGAGREMDPQAVANITRRQALKMFLNTPAVYHKKQLHPNY
jgi:hypothetical protein